MTAQLRNDFEKKMHGFEPGTFQEFMLRLLPLYNKRYEGMRRNGHNENGKTRPGVPDLIKVYDNGDQIGCECGTEEKYWHVPKNKKGWKPIRDLEKCLLKLQQPIEIVLASNQPMPPSNPNILNEIISHCPSKNCSIKILSSEDLASWLEINISRTEVFELAKEFFPDITMPKDSADVIGFMTGGDNFCYMEIYGINNNIGNVLVHNPGKYPMYNIQARILDACEFERTNNLAVSEFIRSYGEIPANHVLRTSTLWNLGDCLERKFNIFWTARNGSFTQLLRFKKTPQGWRQATKVINYSNQILYEKKQEHFPTNENEHVQWD